MLIYSRPRHSFLLFHIRTSRMSHERFRMPMKMTMVPSPFILIASTLPPCLSASRGSRCDSMVENKMEMWVRVGRRSYCCQRHSWDLFHASDYFCFFLSPTGKQAHVLLPTHRSRISSFSAPASQRLRISPVTCAMQDLRTISRHGECAHDDVRLCLPTRANESAGGERTNATDTSSVLRNARIESILEVF
jgi:hypothetical protein